MKLWVIYERPRDYPDFYVVRMQEVAEDGTIRKSPDCQLADDLDSARDYIPEGLTNIGRQPGDDPVIKEVWI